MKVNKTQSHPEEQTHQISIWKNGRKYRDYQPYIGFEGFHSDGYEEYCLMGYNVV
jgi:hypothetical protein